MTARRAVASGIFIVAGCWLMAPGLAAAALQPVFLAAPARVLVAAALQPSAADWAALVGFVLFGVGAALTMD